MGLVFRLLICFHILSSSLFAKTIAIVPDSPRSLSKVLESQNKKSLIHHPLGRVIYDLRDSDVVFAQKSYYGISGEILRSADKIVFFNIYQSLPMWFCQVPKSKRYLIAFEPPSVYPWMYSDKCKDLFHKILTFDDDLVNIAPFVKYYYPVLKPMISNLPDFSKKKLLCILAANKTSKHPNELYSERKKAIAFFDQNYKEEFDLYGPKWEEEGFKTYRGVVPIKEDVLKHYKFSICYENIENVAGYITEKIFECFQAGNIPIYLGASNITDYIPRTCFIDKNAFATYEELTTFLKNMDEFTYNSYVTNIQKFLSSKKAKLYSVENFSKVFQKEIIFD